MKIINAGFLAKLQNEDRQRYNINNFSLELLKQCINEMFYSKVNRKNIKPLRFIILAKNKKEAQAKILKMLSHYE